MDDVVVIAPNKDFYPRPPRGGRPAFPHNPVLGVAISIHALREEGDATASSKVISLRLFLSTPSARRATWIASVSYTHLVR